MSRARGQLALHGFKLERQRQRGNRAHSHRRAGPITAAGARPRSARTGTASGRQAAPVWGGCCGHALLSREYFLSRPLLLSPLLPLGGARSPVAIRNDVPAAAAAGRGSPSPVTRRSPWFASQMFGGPPAAGAWRAPINHRLATAAINRAYPYLLASSVYVSRLKFMFKTYAKSLMCASHIVTLCLLLCRIPVWFCSKFRVNWRLKKSLCFLVRWLIHYYSHCRPSLSLSQTTITRLGKLLAMACVKELFPRLPSRLFPTNRSLRWHCPAQRWWKSYGSLVAFRSSPHACWWSADGDGAVVEGRKSIWSLLHCKPWSLLS